MNAKNTLVSLFNKEKEILEKQLTGLLLPKDAERIQNTIIVYLEKLLDNDSCFRQGLTQCEDHILQASLSLIDASPKISYIPEEEQEECSKEETPNSYKHIEEGRLLSLGITALGGATGLLLLGGWGAVLGAVASNAIVLYTNNSKKTTQQPEANPDNCDYEALDIPLMMQSVETYCQKVDILVETIRIQIKKLQFYYEQERKHSLFSNYSTLIEKIELLINVADNKDVDKEELLLQIDLLRRSLKNYGILYENGKLINKE